MDPGIRPLREVADHELYKRERAAAQTWNVGILWQDTRARDPTDPRGRCADGVRRACFSQALDLLFIDPHPLQPHLPGELEDAGLGDAAELAIPQRNVVD